MSPIRHQRRSQEHDQFQGEIRNIRLPTFDVGNKIVEDDEAWILGMKNYFQLHNYSSILETIIAINNL